MSFYRRIHRYAFDGSFEKIKDLLDKFPDRLLESDPLYRRTALHYCSIKGHLRIAKYIIENFKDSYEILSRKDSRGFTCLHYASLNGHSDLLSLILLQEVIPVDDNENVDKKTPLHLCAQDENDCSDCFKLLLQHGANPKIKDCDGYTVEELSQKIPKIKAIYESFLDGLFDIWDDSRSQISKKALALERKQKGRIFPYFKFRLGLQLDGGPGIRLVIKRLLSLNEGDPDFLEICANYLTKMHESQWRGVIKNLVCFSNKNERMSYVIKNFFDEVKEKDESFVSDVFLHYLLLSYCQAGVEYSFDFLESIWDTRSRSTTIQLLGELNASNLCEVDFDGKIIKLNEVQVELLSKKRRFVCQYLCSRFGVGKEEDLENLFVVDNRSSEQKNDQLKSIPKKRVRTKNKKPKSKKKKQRSESIIDPPTINFLELENVLERNVFTSKINFSRGFRVALVIGNTSFEAKKYKIFSSSTNCEEDVSSTVSEELMQNDCTAITCLLKNKLSFDVVQKKNLSGKGINIELSRIFSTCGSIRRKNKGKPIILFIYLSGHFEDGKFLGTDNKNSFEHKYLDLRRMFCEIEESQLHEFDFCYLLFHPLPQPDENVSSKPFSRIPIGVPFQGIIGSTTNNNNIQTTFDGCLSKFSKHFCRYFGSGRLDIVQIFRKMRKKKVEVEFQSNFGNYSTSELILNPNFQVSESLPVPSLGGLRFSDENHLERLEFEIRDAKKKKKKVAFIVYHSTFNPPLEYEEKMMETFKEAVEGSFLPLPLEIFTSQLEEMWRLETSPSTDETIRESVVACSGGDSRLLKVGGELVVQRFKDKKLSSSFSTPQKRSNNDDSDPSFLTPIRSRSTSCKILFPSEKKELFLTPDRIRSRASSCRSRSVSTSSRVRARRSSYLSHHDDEEDDDSQSMAGSIDDDTAPPPPSCSVLRYIWVNSRNNCYFMSNNRMDEKKEGIKKLNLRIQRVESDILKLRECVEPTDFLLSAFQFLYVLFIRKMEEGKNLLISGYADSSHKYSDDISPKNEEKEEELERELLLQSEDGEEKKFVEEEKKEGQEEEEEGGGGGRDEIDIRKEEQSRKLWETYAPLIWSRGFLKVLYEYDFQISGAMILDQLEEIYERMKELVDTNDTVEKLLLEFAKKWIEFFECKYVLSEAKEKEEEKEAYLQIVENMNKNVILLKGNNRVGDSTLSNNDMVASTPQRMIDYVRRSIVSQMSFSESDDFCVFLGLTDSQFLEEDFELIPRDVPLLIGCTSLEKKAEVKKKIMTKKGLLNCFLRILMVDLVDKEENQEEDGIFIEPKYCDTSKIREDIVAKMEELRKRDKKNGITWEMGRK